MINIYISTFLNLTFRNLNATFSVKAVKIVIKGIIDFIKANTAYKNNIEYCMAVRWSA